MKTVMLLETGVFADRHQKLIDACEHYGVKVLEWDDQWVLNHSFPQLKNNKVIFHGSLGNADYIVKNKLWSPGAFCNVDAFKCTSWYLQTSPWLFQKNWILSTVQEFVKNTQETIKGLEFKEFFVRPNSPLKPFAGRVLSADNITMQSLDFGFYYNNPNEEIIICSTQEVIKEWRYVICNNAVITGSSYLANNRAADDSEWQGKPLQLAKEIAHLLNAPDILYVLDVCLSKEGYKLLELNPFSGADLYNCDRNEIVKAIIGL